MAAISSVRSALGSVCLLRPLHLEWESDVPLLVSSVSPCLLGRSPKPCLRLGLPVSRSPRRVGVRCPLVSSLVSSLSLYRGVHTSPSQSSISSPAKESAASSFRRSHPGEGTGLPAVWVSDWVSSVCRSHPSRPSHPPHPPHPSLQMSVPLPCRTFPSLVSCLCLGLGLPVTLPSSLRSVSIYRLLGSPRSHPWLPKRVWSPTTAISSTPRFGGGGGGVRVESRESAACGSVQRHKLGRDRCLATSQIAAGERRQDLAAVAAKRSSRRSTRSGANCRKRGAGHFLSLFSLSLSLFS
jgi:hypothetical protein